MKKYVNFAFAYAIAALCAGVFYREFTKLSGFSGRTALAFVHPHLFMLGMCVMLLAALFVFVLKADSCKLWKPFMVCYSIGVPLTALMLAVRGVVQVLGTELSRGADAAISGVAGIGHILAGAGILLFLLCLKKTAK